MQPRLRDAESSSPTPAAAGRFPRGALSFAGPEEEEDLATSQEEMDWVEEAAAGPVDTPASGTQDGSSDPSQSGDAGTGG